MLRLIKSWFGAAEKQPVSTELPDEVKTAISGATVIDRGMRGNEVSLIVMPCGHGGFRFSAESGRAWLQSAFPELTPEQIARGVRYLGSHVRERQQRQAYDQMAGHQPTGWSAWKPLRHSER